MILNQLLDNSQLDDFNSNESSYCVGALGESNPFSEEGKDILHGGGEHATNDNFWSISA